MGANFRHFRHSKGGAAPPEPGAEVPITESEFITKCKEMESEVVDDTTDEANDKPLENSNGKRMLRMGKDKGGRQRNARKRDATSSILFLLGFQRFRDVSLRDI